MDENASGKLLFVVLAATLLAVIAALAVARRYRAAMQRLMSQPAPPQHEPAGSAAPSVASAPAARVTLADNRRAARRVALLLLLMSALLSTSDAALFLGIAGGREGLLTPARLATLATLNLWPVIPALGLLWRWSRWRVLGALLLWFAGALLLIAWRSIEPQPLASVLFFLVSEIGGPMLLIGALCLGSATRAIAPWLLPLLMLLVATSVAGTDALAWIVAQRP
ncbi:MAG: hypothetical protein JSR75_08930, partial [Proteobacteria bacterium]|nr:hypothetical protein [Pseudomonadota bacterium]